MGASCYINSCIQILIHLEIFMKALNTKIEDIKNKKLSISYKFYNVCIDYLNNSNIDKKFIDISYFVNYFSNKHPEYSGELQSDALEFIRLLLDDISLDLNGSKIKYSHTILSNDDKNKLIRYKEFIDLFNSKEKSIVTELFYPVTITTYICKCLKVNYSFQRYCDIPLLMPINTKEIDPDIIKLELVNLIDNFFKEEVIQFDTRCNQCKQILPHKKSMKLCKLPKVIVFSLQRFDNKNKQKNNTLVTFPEFLDLKNYVDIDCETEDNFIYKLYGTINHRGDLDFGHYFSIIKLKGQNYWYEFNDAYVDNLGLDLV